MEKYYLNFSNLNEETQDIIMQDVIHDLEVTEGKEILEADAKTMNIDYETYITEKAERHLYNFDFIFNV
ncbi:MAG TPA: hypothetical protein GX695_05105 [Acholeplasmataceae bacterium]|nr:hypothetical protein [Acholeplasmataceae bacterium]